MCAAARIVKKGDKYDKRYRQFMFLITTTLVHESGHNFISYLCRDRTPTPPQLTGREGGSKDRGEGGAHFESLLFGGIVIGTRNPNDDDDHQV